MKLSDLTSSLTVLERSGGAPDVLAIAHNSRNVRPGSLFVAIKGGVTDGHDFLDEAVGLGAVAAVVERWRPDLPIAQVRVGDSRRALAILANRFFDYPSHKLKLIGITGTNGKTTTAYILESILRRAGYATGLIGTIEYRINGERIVAERTTPESLELQQMLASMVLKGVRAAIMEVSSHALDLGRVDGCRFAARVFTNLSRDHLDYHSDMEKYFAVKARLFLDPAFGPAVSLIDADDIFGRRLLKMIKGGHGFGAGAEDYRISHVHSATTETSFQLEGPAGSVMINSPLLGEFNVANSAAAAAVALELGVDAGAVVEGISGMAIVPGRFERVNCAHDFHVVVDYAHTPDGLEKVLQAARKLADPNRLITVFGCGGDRDRGKRPRMGRIAADLSDVAIVTSDNPRSESPETIIDEILGGIESPHFHKTQVEVERETAIKLAISQARSGDVVVIAGKGHENYQLIKDKVLPFDDRRVAEKALRELCV